MAGGGAECVRGQRTHASLARFALWEHVNRPAARLHGTAGIASDLHCRRLLASRRPSSAGGRLAHPPAPPSLLQLPKVPMPPPFQPDVWTRRSAGPGCGRELVAWPPLWLCSCLSRPAGARSRLCGWIARMTPTTACNHDRPATRLPPRRWERNPHAGPFTRQLYDAIVQMVTAINAGIDEVGGANWKEVLGRRAALRRQGADAASSAAGAAPTSNTDTGAKAAAGPHALGSSAAAGAAASASAAAAGSAAASRSARAGGVASTAATAPPVATLESSRAGATAGGSVDVLS